MPTHWHTHRTHGCTRCTRRARSAAARSPVLACVRARARARVRARAFGACECASHVLKQLSLRRLLAKARVELVPAACVHACACAGHARTRLRRLPWATRCVCARGTDLIRRGHTHTKQSEYAPRGTAAQTRKQTKGAGKGGEIAKGNKGRGKIIRGSHRRLGALVGSSAACASCCAYELVLPHAVDAKHAHARACRARAPRARAFRTPARR
jgi:hypothetical protein